jgi:hypothetical protein
MPFFNGPQIYTSTGAVEFDIANNTLLGISNAANSSLHVNTAADSILTITTVGNTTLAINTVDDSTLTFPEIDTQTANVLTSPGAIKVYNNAAHPNLTLADSGCTIFVIQDGAYTINVPDPDADTLGCTFKFIIVQSGANVVTINTVTPNNGNFLISIANGDGVTQTSKPTVGQNTVKYAATATIGDTIELISTGGLWIGTGVAQLHDKITCP